MRALLLLAACSAAGCGASVVGKGVQGGGVSAAPLGQEAFCIEAEADDHASGIQRFHFDSAGDLVMHEQFDNQRALLDRKRLLWTHDRIEERHEGKPGPGAVFELGAHGELLHAALGPNDVVDLVWDGAFSEAKPRWFFEGLYAPSSGDVHLPRNTAERTIFARMRPSSFTGTVVLRRKGLGAGETTARYEGGRRVELKSGDLVLVGRWSSGGLLEREEIRRDAELVDTLEYRYGPSGLLEGFGSQTRSAKFSRSEERLVRVQTSNANVDLRPCPP